jgi:outer membrane protein
MFMLHLQMQGALNAHESAIVALESRQEAYIMKDLMLAWWILLISNLLSNAQSDVLRTKYDYIFKIKILEFYFGIPIIKTNTLCQRNQFTS